MRLFPRLAIIGAVLAAAVLLLGFPASADAAEGAAVTLRWSPPPILLGSNTTNTASPTTTA